MKRYHDIEYLRVLRYIYKTGVPKNDRTGTGTISGFAHQMRFDLTNNSIPLLTTKKIFTRSVVHEIIWYLRGDSTTKYLNDNNVHIWDNWADQHGELGPIYGVQWRKCPSVSLYDHHIGPLTLHQFKDMGRDGYTCDVMVNYIDQVAEVVDKLKHDPDNRRIIIDAWNVAQLDQMALPPCHAFVQFWSRELTVDERIDWVYKNVDDMHIINEVCDWETIFDRYAVPKRGLKCHLYQRSCDLFLGVPFNIVQYSMITHAFAHVTNHIAEEFIWSGGDVHIYNNHFEQVEEQLSRIPYPSPTLRLNQNVNNIDDFKYEDFEILGYDYHPHIKAEVSV